MDEKTKMMTLKEQLDNQIQQNRKQERNKQMGEKMEDKNNIMLNLLELERIKEKERQKRIEQKKLLESDWDRSNQIQSILKDLHSNRFHKALDIHREGLAMPTVESVRPLEPQTHRDLTDQKKISDLIAKDTHSKLPDIATPRTKTNKSMTGKRNKLKGSRSNMGLTTQSAKKYPWEKRSRDNSLRSSVRNLKSGALRNKL